MTNEVVKEVREVLYFLASLEIEVNNNAAKTNEDDKSPIVLQG